MEVYASVCFAIKNTLFSQNEALHLFKTIELTWMLIPDVRNIVYSVIQRNAFFAHPENFLLSMINDESSDIRQLRWSKSRRRESNL